MTRQETYTSCTNIPLLALENTFVESARSTNGGGLTFEQLCQQTFESTSPIQKYDRISGVKIQFHELYRIEPAVLGEGAYSTVREAIRRCSDDGIIYAVKTVHRRKLSKKEETSLRNEVDILRELRHGAKHIVRLYDFFTTPNDHHLVMERQTGGELFDRIVSKGYYKEAEAKQICINLLRAVDYCHQNNVVHRDLKPDNILLTSRDNDTDIRLADFGFAKKISKPDSLLTMCGTLGYMAPEILKRLPYGKHADMFSVGVIMYMLLCGAPAFYDEHSTKEMLRQNIECDYNFNNPIWDDISENAKDLIDCLLTADPARRFSSSEALDSAWVQGDAMVQTEVSKEIVGPTSRKSRASNVLFKTAKSLGNSLGRNRIGLIFCVRA